MTKSKAKKRGRPKKRKLPTEFKMLEGHFNNSFRFGHDHQVTFGLAEKTYQALKAVAKKNFRSVHGEARDIILAGVIKEENDQRE